MHPEGPEKQEKGLEKVVKAKTWVLLRVPSQSFQELLAPDLDSPQTVPA